MILNLWSHIFNGNYVQGVEYPMSGHYKYNFFKHFDMFVVEATNDLRNYLFLDGRFAKIICFSTDVFRNCFILQQVVVGIFFSSTDSLLGFFYSLNSLCLTKC